MTEYQVTCTQPDGTKFVSSPRTKAQAVTLAANFAGKRKRKPSLCVVKDIRIVESPAGAGARLIDFVPDNVTSWTPMTDRQYAALMKRLRDRNQSYPEYVEAQVQANKARTLAERAASPAVVDCQP